MKRREKQSGQVNLDRSEDEIMLSALMRKSLDGDSESYRLLLQKVKELMTPFIANTLAKFGLASGGGQEDVIQEVLLGIHLKRASFDPQQFFLPWMYAIARYKAIDHLRKNKISFQVVSIEESYEEFEFSQSADLAAELDIESLCEKLPAKQRDILLLVKVDGLSVKEVSIKTGFSVSDVKVTVHRALKELKRQVKDAGYEN